MLVRAALLASAVAALVLLGRSLSAHDRCQSALGVVLHASLRRGPVTAAEQDAIARVRGACDGDTGLLSAAGGLAIQNRRREALGLALEAARQEPRDARAWRAVGAIAAGQAPALARAAERRLSVLDPLGRTSFSRSSGRSSR